MMESMWNEKVRSYKRSNDQDQKKHSVIFCHVSLIMQNSETGQYDAPAAVQLCPPGFDVKGVRRLHQDGKT